MKKVILKIVSYSSVKVALQVVVLATIVALPTVVFAQSQPAISCPRDLGYFCPADGSVASMFRVILNWALTLAFLAAVIYLIVGGFQYISSAGNTEQATKGRATITNALIGIVIVVLSYTIVQIVYNFVSGSIVGQ